MARPRTVPPPSSGDRWTRPTRIAFRFAVLYLGFFVLATQISGSLLPNLSFSYRGLGRLWPMRDITEWTAQHVVGVRR